MEIRQKYNLTKGLGLYLPTEYARKWEMERGIAESRTVTLKIPLSILRTLFDTIGALTAKDVGIVLARWAGMNDRIANLMNKDLNDFYTILTAQGMKHRFKLNQEPKSWAKAREMGWDDTKS